MANRHPHAVGEWYHCYTRGVDKRTVFETPIEYERFLVYLYITNGSHKLPLSNVKNQRLSSVLSDERLDRGSPLVEIGAYALMPSHVHLLIREVVDGGIASFMQKVFTGYTLYFNKRRQRTGALFSGTYKSKHVHDDRYFKQVLPYILLNPAELFEPRWKDGVGNLPLLQQQLLAYPYASFQDFFGTQRLENKILTSDLSAYFHMKPTMQDMLGSAQAYYQFHPES
jgi:putative transposase